MIEYLVSKALQQLLRLQFPSINSGKESHVSMFFQLDYLTAEAFNFYGLKELALIFYQRHWLEHMQTNAKIAYMCYFHGDAKFALVLLSRVYFFSDVYLPSLFRAGVVSLVSKINELRRQVEVKASAVAECQLNHQ